MQIVYEAPEPPIQQQEAIVQYVQQAPVQAPMQQASEPHQLQQEVDNQQYQQQIQIVIANLNVENGALASSTPKLNKTVNLNLLVDDVSSKVL